MGLNWRVKGVIQKALSAVPGGVEVNDLLQRSAGGLRKFDRHVAIKVDDWRILASHLRELGRSTQGLSFVEVGTGWHPVLPVCFALAGAAECHTYDLNRHLDDRLTLRMLGLLRQHLPTIARASDRPLPEVESDYERLVVATDAEALLKQARIVYHAPADATVTGLPDASVDVVYSNSVLEHVPPEIIARLMVESQRTLRPGGLSVHSVNCGDHYAYFDSGITPINYLTIPEKDWAFWNNRLLYQNRLRPSDFVTMAEAAGLDVVLRKAEPRADLLKLLPNLSVAPEFRNYPESDLCATSVDFVARKS